MDLQKQPDSSKEGSTFLKRDDELNTVSKESGTDKDLEKASAEVADVSNNELYKDIEKLKDTEPATIKPDVVKPDISKPKIKFRMPDKNFYNILLMTLGVVFVLLAGIIFATTNWHAMSGFTKLLCILCAVLSVYVLSFFAEK